MEILHLGKKNGDKGSLVPEKVMYDEKTLKSFVSKN